MSTEQKQDIHCGTCTVKGDVVACLATPCSVRSSWFANSQAAEIERLAKENNVHVKRREYSTEYANVQANEALLYQKTISDLRKENEALKADAERWKTIKPHFYFDNEGGHGFWNCSISSESWTVDGIIPDAAIDAMKGAT